MYTYPVVAVTIGWSSYADPKYSWVQTDMGNAAATVVGKETADITLEESIPGIVSLVSFPHEHFSLV